MMIRSKKIVLGLTLILSSLFVIGCQCLAPEDLAKTSAPKEYKELTPYPSQALPSGLVWQTEEDAPVFASPEAQKGGKYIGAISMFPLTLRMVGPDSSSGPSRGLIYGNKMSLIIEHPNMDKWLPALASHWSYQNDGKTTYFKIRPEARWSDGRPVTADDFMFYTEFMSSKNIMAPFYNNYIEEWIEKIVKYDDHTISIHLKKAVPDDEALGKMALSPMPRHFYNGEVPEDFIRRYNWKVEPNTGPYYLSKMRKGKYILFKRKKNWWAKDLNYFKNRFNVDYAKYIVVRNSDKKFRLFKKGKLSTFQITEAKHWFDKTNSREFTYGFIRKLEAWNDKNRTPGGFYLNSRHKLLKDRNTRLGIGHALNFKRVIKEFFRGDRLRLKHAYEGTGEYENKQLLPPTFNPKLAAKYLNAAGWGKRDKKGIRMRGRDRLSFTITNPTKANNPMFEILREEAVKIGVEFNIQNVDSTQFFKIISNKKHSIIPMAFGSGAIPRYRQMYHSSFAGKENNNNVTNTSDKKLDAMIEAYRNTRNGEERRSLSRQIQKYAHDLAVFIPFAHQPFFREAHWRWFRAPGPPGTKISSTAFALFDESTGGRFWFDPDMKKLTDRAMRDGTKLSSDILIDKTFKPAP